MVLQPKNGFDDYLKCAPKNYITRVSQVTWDFNKFYVPAEYDVFIYFTPYGNSDLSPWLVEGGSNSGKIKVTA